MGVINLKKDKIFAGIVIAVSVAGILYFGYRAIRENAENAQQNPFAYDIKNYEKSGSDLIHYAEVGRISIDLPRVQGIAIGPDDRIYVSGSDSVFVFNKDGTERSSFNSSVTARCLSVDKNNDLYLGAEDHVEVYSADGVKKASWGSLGEQAIVTSITVAETNVFVADAGNKIVWKFDKSGSRLQRYSWIHHPQSLF